MRNIRPLSILCLICVFLVGYQFMGAAVWTSPTASPPNNNTDSPVNIGVTTQQKAGNLQANIFAASSEVRSDRYCDALGGNCFDASQVAKAESCPNGEFVKGFKANGGLICADAGGGSTNCVLEQRTVSACLYQGNNMPACPSGYQSVSVTQAGRCSTNNDTYVRLCQKVVCS